MKHMKKLASLLLALVMVLALATTAFAAGDEKGTITVDNPQKDQTYTAYKIFDVTYDDATPKHYAYTIDSDAKGTWFEDVLTYMGGGTNQATADSDGVYKGKGITLTPSATDGTLYVVEIATEAAEGTEKFSAPAFAAFLNEKKTDKNGTTLEKQTVGDKEVVQASNLELGYYFVSSTSGALCNLTTTNPTVTIHDKNDIPFDKEDDKSTVEIGEVVNYVITGKVPDTTGFETYKYQITDKMSEGLTFNNDVKVYIDGEEATANFTLKTGTDAGEKDFVLDIEVMNLTVGAKIEVKYSATVNEKAIAKIEKNRATLEYSTDPTNEAKTTTREDVEEVYSAKIVIDKYAQQPVAEGEEEDTSKKLQGATFVLYKVVSYVENPPEGETEPHKLYYKYTPAKAAEGTNPAVEAKVEWVTDKAQATTYTTDENGAATFIGLKDGEYYLEETAAPAGYNLLKEPVPVTIKGTEDDNTTVDESKLSLTAQVANNTGTELPSTGGMGTKIFYVVGSILLVGAAVLLITKKRMSAAK